LFYRKTDNDSEQEDSEVRKLTAKIEHEKAQKKRSPSAHSSHQPTFKKTMILSSDQLKRLNLKLGTNKVEFSVTTALQGTTTVESNIFFFDHMTKFVISDIDGTITKYKFN
jgi:phosphatidate phosphatase LPIN